VILKPVDPFCIKPFQPPVAYIQQIFMVPRHLQYLDATKIFPSIEVFIKMAPILIGTFHKTQ
jgi:hypothetical protein